MTPTTITFIAGLMLLFASLWNSNQQKKADDEKLHQTQEVLQQTQKTLRQTQENFNIVSGGDSFVHIRPFLHPYGDRTKDKFTPTLMHHGKYPARDIIISSEHLNISMATLFAGGSQAFLNKEIPLDKNLLFRFNIYTTLNRFEQEIIFKKNGGGEWDWQTRVMRINLSPERFVTGFEEVYQTTVGVFIKEEIKWPPMEKRYPISKSLESSEK